MSALWASVIEDKIFAHGCIELHRQPGDRARRFSLSSLGRRVNHDDFTRQCFEWIIAVPLSRAVYPDYPPDYKKSLGKLKIFNGQKNSG
ncbi:hypothetical protein KCP75_22885 [Salmonella enterica subsp. enterica]|nr:hypothetical protein KCP75_22885 [Salmonella enterica subsp. enterica]